MGKIAKVKLASILISAGFNERKVLNLIGYPKCESILYINESDGVMSIFAVTDSGRTRYDLSSSGNGSPLTPKLIPYLDHIEQSGENIYRFYFSNETQTKILAKGNLSIPGAPGWPEIKFLTPKYPIPTS